MSKVHEVVRRDLTFRVSTVPLVAGKCVCVRPEAVAQMNTLSGQIATICVMRNLPDFATIRTRGVSRKSLLAKDSLCSS